MYIHHKVWEEPCQTYTNRCIIIFVCIIIIIIIGSLSSSNVTIRSSSRSIVVVLVVLVLAFTRIICCQLMFLQTTDSFKFEVYGSTFHIDISTIYVISCSHYKFM